MARWLEYTSDFVSGVCLLSAFDIQRGLIPPAAGLPIKPQLIILDSGGYEASQLIGPATLSVAEKDLWTREKYLSVLSAWPDQTPAIFVSYDHPRKFRPLAAQIESARAVQNHFSKHMHCFLLKPEQEVDTRSLEGVIKTAIASADQLIGFNVIGLTDKGLGERPIDRMVRIAELRRALDDAGCDAPIHIFGSLDPLSVCLYYLAGAEIFDGLTWLRYAFDGAACYYHRSYEPLANGLYVKDASTRRQMVESNYWKISELQNQLRLFADTKDFTLLPNSEFLHQASESLKDRL